TVIHLKDENPETYVDNCYTKETQLAIYSNFIRPIRVLSNRSFCRTCC
ncbi:hypothetical protein Golob_017396, partial [Gossypium lobatum]|nr:hypothetical protein [Gossypium lobatum]